MAKIVGFTTRVDGYNTKAGAMNSTLFINACTAAAKKLDINFLDLRTKRQAGKFFKGKGIVYTNTIGSEE